MKNSDYEDIQVESYSGYKANERPVAFTCQGERWEIREIIDRWHEGGLHSGRSVVDYFKVKTADGKVYLLRYEPERDVWSIRLGGTA
jgi:hypothetical protein